MGGKRVKVVEIKLKESAFSVFFKKFRTKDGAMDDLSGISAVRQLLSNEKARILSTLGQRKVSSVYELAKILKRDFKSVRQDVELLKKFELVKLERGKDKRNTLKPALNIDKLQINLSV